MSNNDTLAACLSKIDNASKMSKNQVIIQGVSKMIKKVLDILNKHEYVGKCTYEENSKGGMVEIELLDRINRCGSVKPRYKVKANEIEKYEQRYLPAKSYGVLLISTSKGVMTNSEAKEKGIGGKLIAYCY